MRSSPLRSSRVIALVGVIALAAVALVFFALSDPPASTDLGPASAGSAHAAARSEDVRDLALAPATPEQHPSAATAPERRAAEVERVQPLLAGRAEDELRWIEGVLAWPEGAERDDTLRVLSVAAPERERAVHGLFARWMEQSGEPTADTAVLWASPVEESGAFRVACAPDAQWAWLDVDGRFLYLAEPLPVRIEGPRTEVELFPLEGACISGTWKAPADADARESVLGGGAVWLAAEGGFGFVQVFGSEAEGAVAMFHRVATGSDGSFELRGVDPERAWTLVSQPLYLASRVDDVELEAGEEAELEIALARGTGVAGRVIDSGGEPLAGALVEVVPGKREEEGEEDPAAEHEEGDVGYADDGGPSEIELRWLAQSSVTQSDGTFVFHGLPAGEIVVRAEKDGYRRSIRKKLELAPGEVETGLEIRLRRGEALRGLVSWGDGSPAAGALLQIGRDASEESEPLSIASRSQYGEYTADERGRFEISGLKRRAQSVTAFATRREGERWIEGIVRKDGVKPSEDDEHALVLERRPLLTGFVRDPRGEPVRRFRLVVRPDEGGTSFLSSMMRERSAEEREVESPDGSFRLEKLGDGDFSLFVEAEGYATSRPKGFHLPPDADAPPLEIALAPFAAASGVVRTPAGEPAAGAEVSASAGGAEATALSAEVQAPRSARTNARGEFSFPQLDAGELVLSAALDPWVEALPYTLALAPGEQRAGLALDLRRGARIEGEVQDEHGDPRAECEVSVLVQSAESGPEKPFESVRGQNYRTTATDARGWFEFDALAPGTARVSVLPDEEEDGEDAEMRNFRRRMMFAQSLGVEVALVDGETVRVVLGGATAPAGPLVAVSGRATLRRRPVQGSVSFEPDPPRAGVQEREAALGEGGRFSVELEPGDWNATVTGGPESDTRSHEFHCRIPAAESFELDFALPDARIAGRVLKADGEPAQELPVSLRRVDPSTSALFDFQDSFPGGESTGEDGTYEFTELEPGTYVVSAGNAWIAMFLGGAAGFGRKNSPPIELAADEDRGGVDLVLGAACELGGRVVDVAGEPVNGASIHVFDLSGVPVDPFAAASTNASGRFLCEGLAPGTYTVLARSPALASQVSEDVVVREGDREDVALVAREGAICTIALRAPNGESVRAGFSVTDAGGREHANLRELESAWMGGWWGSRTSLAARVGPLPPGSYRVRARASDGRTVERQVLVRPGERELEIDLALDE